MVSKDCPHCNHAAPDDIPPEIYARSSEAAFVELHRAIHRFNDELMEVMKRAGDAVLQRSWWARIQHGRKQR